MPGATGRTVARLSRLVEVSLASAELSLPQYRLLALLAAEPAVASKLAEYLAVSPPSVTAVVDGLVHRGLVERRADPSDRRRVAHVLTGAGRDVLAEADGAVEARLERVLDRLEAPDGARARQGLALWQQALDADRAARRAEMVAGRRSAR